MQYIPTYSWWKRVVNVSGVFSLICHCSFVPGTDAEVSSTLITSSNSFIIICISCIIYTLPVNSKSGRVKLQWVSRLGRHYMLLRSPRLYSVLAFPFGLIAWKFLACWIADCDYWQRCLSMAGCLVQLQWPCLFPYGESAEKSDIYTVSQN